MTTANGTPVWFELVTPDLDASAAFYEAVAGWSTAPSDHAEHGGYRLAAPPGGGNVAGMMPPYGDMPTGWTVYFAAADVDAMAARATALGGAVRAGPMDIPHVGRFAALADPQGVSFSVIAGMAAGTADAFRQMPGEDCLGRGVWVELATPDPDAAFAFYGDLFGWTKAGAMPMPVLSDAEGGEMGEYAFIGASDDTRPGAVMSSATTGAPARWNWYVHVPDIDAAIATAQARGGTLRQGPDQIPGGDYSANLADPHGSVIGLVGPRVGDA